MRKENEILFPGLSSGYWANIILPLALPTTYMYAIPIHLAERAKPGCRVEVVFGKNKKYAGIVKSIIREKPAYETREIQNVLDDETKPFTTIADAKGLAGLPEDLRDGAARAAKTRGLEGKWVIDNCYRHISIVLLLMDKVQLVKTIEKGTE